MGTRQMPSTRRTGRDPGVAAASTAIARACRYGAPPEEIAALRRQMKCEVLRAHIEWVLGQPQPPDREQRLALALVLLADGGGEVT